MENSKKYAKNKYDTVPEETRFILTSVSLDFLEWTILIPFLFLFLLFCFFVGS